MNEITIARSIGIIYRTFLSYMSKSLSNSDISFSDSIFLMNIGSKSGITSEEISSFLAIDKAAITRSVKEMIKKDLVYTTPHPTDKRSKLLYLTDLGSKKYDEILDLHKSWISAVLNDVSEKEIKLYAELSYKISEKTKNI